MAATVRTLRTSALLFGSTSLLALVALPLPAARADVATDGTLGPRVTLSGADLNVGAELGQVRGRNLFHSFERLNIDSGGRVTFTGPDGLRNVISRVTGGERSSINGTLASAIPGADFYLLNPAGILFGSNARLDVKGSFHASTAEELRFADGAVFSALDTAGSTLSVAEPQAFGFLGANVGRLEIDGSFLILPEGATLALSAGEIALDATFVATVPLLVGPGDTGLAVAAQRGAGEVPVSAAGPAVARDGSVRIGASEQGIPAQLIMSAPDGGRIKIEGGDVVIDGANLFSVSTGAADAVGGIDIAAQTLTLQQRSFDVGAGAQPFGNLVTSSAGTGAAGPLRLSATDSIDINGSIVASSPIGVGGAGPVTVTTDRLSMNFGAIGTPTGLQSGGVPVRGSSNATTVEARSSILLTEGAQILSSSFGDAEAGPLTVSTQGTIMISNGARISASTFGAGKAGDLTVTAAEINLSNLGQIEGSSFGAGAAGSIDIVADTLAMQSAGRVISTTSASGEGGAVRIQAGSLNAAGGLSGNGQLIASGVNTSAQPGSSGNAGTIAIDANSIQLTDGGQIFSGTFATGQGGSVIIGQSVPDGAVRVDGIFFDGDNFFPSAILATAENGSTGAAGTVAVTARRVELRDGGRITGGTTGVGDGGSVTVAAADVVIGGASAVPGRVLKSGILATADPAGPGLGGAAGTVDVAVSQLTVRTGGTISSSTGTPGPAGTVRVSATGPVAVDGGSIETNSTSPGAAGDVVIGAPRLTVKAGGLIGSSGSGVGAAGNVRIQAGRLQVQDASIRTEGTGGEGGRIAVRADDRIYLRRSEVTSNGIEPATGASVISLTAPQIVLNASTVTSLTGGGTPLAGSGEAQLLGDITVISADSVVTASSSVDISGLQTNLGSDLQLPTNVFLDASRLLRDSCAASGGGPRSSFTRGGRGGLPLSPDRPLPSAGADGPAEDEGEAAAEPAFLDVCGGLPQSETRS